MLFTGRRMGISREGDILDLGAEMSVLKKMGAFYSFGELRLGQGRENARTFLIDNPELTQEIEGLIRTAAAAAAGEPDLERRQAGAGGGRRRGPRGRGRGSVGLEAAAATAAVDGDDQRDRAAEAAAAR